MITRAQRIDTLHRVIAAQNESGLYGIDASGKRLDAGEVVGFARLLENVENTVYEQLYQDVAYRRLFSMAGGFAEQEFHTYRSYTKAGEAAVIHNHASDYPRVTLGTNPEDKQPTRTIGDSYEFTRMQLAQAMRNGMQLDSLLAATAREAIERKADKIACIGSTDDGIPSFATNAAITAVTASTKTGGGTVWSSYTGGATGAQASEIVGDLTKLVKTLADTTKNTFGANAPVTVAFGTLAWNFAQYTYVMSPNYPPFTTFMDLFRKIPNLRRIEYWPQLDAIGAGTKERLVAWIDDPRVAQLSMPQDVQVSPPEPRNKAFVINVDMRFSGVVLRHPKAVAYMDSTQP